MRLNKVFGYVFSIIMLTGCASIHGPKFADKTLKIDPSRGSVLIYRVNTVKGRVWSHQYYIDGILVADLKSGGFTQILVNPGNYIVSYGPENNITFRQLELSVKEGGKYYLEANPGMTLLDIDKFTIKSDGEAFNAIKNNKYQEPVIEIFDSVTTSK